MAGKAKDAQGNIVTVKDKEVQLEIASKIYDARYPYMIVGEEDIDDLAPGVCLTQFPNTLTRDDIVAIIDPTDGSKNWTMGKIFSVTFALQKGNDILVAVVYFPLTDKVYVMDPHDGMTINSEAFTPRFKRLNDGGLSVCFGLGKALAKWEEDYFIHLLVNLSKDEVELNRHGCASASFFEVFCGNSDCYATAKERWTNIAPLYKFAKYLGYYITIDAVTLDKNSDFRMAVATPEFAAVHLTQETTLTTFLNNQAP